MARSKSGVLGSGAYRQPVSERANLPWAQIEKCVGVSFDNQARREIFRCYIGYYATLSVEQDRVPPGDVEALRNAIAGSAQRLLDVLEHFRNPRRALAGDADEALFSALALASTAEGFDLTHTLRQIEPQCRELLRGLGDGAVEFSTTAATPEVVALASFFKEALSGAQPSPARSNPGYAKEATTFEHARWGVPIGPKSALSAAFAGAVLGRSVSQPQVEHAFKLS